MIPIIDPIKVPKIARAWILNEDVAMSGASIGRRCETAEGALVRTKRTNIAKIWSREVYANIERLNLVAAGSGIVASSA